MTDDVKTLAARLQRFIAHNICALPLFDTNCHDEHIRIVGFADKRIAELEEALGRLK